MKFFKWILFAAVLLLALGIFALSSQPRDDSNKLSGNFTIRIVQLYQQITGNADSERIHEIAEDIHGITRKYAHFVLYTILGILTGLLFSAGKRRWSALPAWILCVLYAISDEYHQTFVSGRSGEVRDVLIDSAGALLGITAVMLTGWLNAKIKSTK